MHRLVAKTATAVLLPLIGIACWFPPLGIDDEAFLEPDAAGADHAFQGEYASQPTGAQPTGAQRGGAQTLAAQVIALGDGGFEVVFLRGGLPGAGWDGRPGIRVAGRRDDTIVRFDGDFHATIQNGRLEGQDPQAAGLPFRLDRIVRASPTLGKAAPPDAVVLFGNDGAGSEIDGRADARGFLAVPATSERAFQNFHLHLEFRTPYMPKARGQRRGNSGVYLQERYEIQVLDSFGEGGADNECGAVYRQRAPDLDMALPPLQWQSYDIEFEAARFDQQGRKRANAVVTVDHNGVRIHDRVELSGPTGNGDAESPAAGRLHLQDHWDPVFYRNVWVVPR